MKSGERQVALATQPRAVGSGSRDPVKLRMVAIRLFSTVLSDPVATARVFDARLIQAVDLQPDWAGAGALEAI